MDVIVISKSVGERGGIAMKWSWLQRGRMLRDERQQPAPSRHVEHVREGRRDAQRLRGGKQVTRVWRLGLAAGAWVFAARVSTWHNLARVSTWQPGEAINLATWRDYQPGNLSKRKPATSPISPAGSAQIGLLGHKLRPAFPGL